VTGRILRIELRRSAAVWICPLVAVVGAAMLYIGFDGWGGRWLNLATSLRACLMLLIPLVAGAGAGQGRRDRHAAAEELLATTPRPAWQRATVTASALAIAGAVGFLGNMVAAQIRSRAGRRLHSPALIADGDHARADAYVSLAVVASAAAVAAGAPVADPLIGLAITVVILRITAQSWRTVREGHQHHH